MIVDASPGTPYWHSFKKAMNSGPPLDKDEKAKMRGFAIREYRYVEEDGYEYLRVVTLEFESEHDLTLFMLRWQ